jgi:molybdate transport system regulatory protein
MTQSLKTRPRPAASGLHPRIKVWLETNGRYGFCNGMCQMLQAVERTGSIKQAACELGRSYRYVWGRIKSAEQVFGRQLVETHIGGKDTQRSSLTAAAKHLVTAFLALHARITDVLGEEFARCFQHFA